MKKSVYIYKIITKDNEYNKEYDKNEYINNIDNDVIKEMIDENNININDITDIYIKEWISNDNFINNAIENEVIIINLNELI